MPLLRRFSCLVLLLVGGLLAPAQDDIAEELARAYMLSGTISSPTGYAEGVEVRLEIHDPAIRRIVGRMTTRTDFQGYFQFDLSGRDIPEYALEFITSSRRYVEVNRIVRIRRSQLPHHVELQVVPGSVARGTVRDVDGTPLDGVSIIGIGVTTFRSSEDGTWEVFGIPTGRHTMRFVMEGYAPESLSVTMDEPRIVDGYEVVMAGARALTGTLVDWDGTPLSEGAVILRSRERSQRATTDSEGRFRFRNVPETNPGFSIEAWRDGYLPTERKLTDEEWESGELTCVIDRGAYLEGRVTLPDGNPAAGAQIYVGEVLDQRAVYALADNTGHWRVGPLAPGTTASIAVLPAATRSTWGQAELELQDLGNGRLAGDVELWPQGFSSLFEGSATDDTITLVRRDTGDRGIPAEVHYTGQRDAETGNFRGTLTVPALKQEGTFEMIPRRLRPNSLHGLWELREEIGPSQLEVAPVIADVSTGYLIGTRRLEMQLDEGRQLAGVVLREDGRPVVDGEVVLLEWHGTSLHKSQARVGLAGRFTMERLPDGPIVIGVREVDNPRAPWIVEPHLLRAGLADVVLRQGDGEPDPVDE